MKAEIGIPYASNPATCPIRSLQDWLERSGIGNGPLFLVLGLRPGEMFALRWNGKQGNNLRIDTAIVDGSEVETKTEGSDAAVWLQVSIEKELEFWRSANENVLPDQFIFPSARGTAINTNNFLFRVLKEAGKKAEIKGVRHQMLRRTCSTYMAQLSTVKDVQAHPPPQLLRDDAGALHQIRTGERSDSGRIARPSAEKGARGFRTARELNPIESDFVGGRTLTD